MAGADRSTGQHCLGHEKWCFNWHAMSKFGQSFITDILDIL